MDRSSPTWAPRICAYPSSTRFPIPIAGRTPAPRVDFRTLGSLDFAAPDEEAFRCLHLADIAGRTGGTLPCVLNAANEVAVAGFLQGACRFTDIDAIVEACMDEHDAQAVESLEAARRYRCRHQAPCGPTARRAPVTPIRTGFDGHDRWLSLRALLGRRDLFRPRLHSRRRAFPRGARLRRPRVGILLGHAVPLQPPPRFAPHRHEVRRPRPSSLVVMRPICGMEDLDEPCAPHVLAEIHRRGSASTAELARDLGYDEEDVQAACAQLLSLGFARRALHRRRRPGQPVLSERLCGPCRATLPATRFTTAARSTARTQPQRASRGSRRWGSRRFSIGNVRTPIWVLASCAARSSWSPAILVNVFAGMLLLMSVYSIIGFDIPVNENVIGTVEAGSPAQEAGLAAGDKILSIDGQEIETWVDITSHPST